ncbi:uncharacterized protein LOC125230132 [Leguminivora glycinivorella]|uniref:uncharacterized protein LOC125230132 n=1 Tax=Leguminivora glycinivorella TaxID=1035111 RepID=UPI00200D67F2|nr:uncharacterized protein LOC125230132 [Leguminivora glycinivorella]
MYFLKSVLVIFTAIFNYNLSLLQFLEPSCFQEENLVDSSIPTTELKSSTVELDQPHTSQKLNLTVPGLPFEAETGALETKSTLVEEKETSDPKTLLYVQKAGICNTIGTYRKLNATKISLLFYMFYK